MSNAGGVYTWSQTPNTNATADSTVNWAEGQAPSSINDSARNGMASVAKWRDDIAGAIVTAGTSTAYTVSSFQNFAATSSAPLTAMNGQVIAFTPHVTNGSTVTMNVDSLGAKPLRTAPNVELTSGVLIQGTPYEAIYNSTDATFYLKGFFGNPYGIPIGATLDFWLPTAPNSSFVFPYGQAISRTTYATLFAAMSTTFGAGDGSTTFNLPDLRGRTTACMDVMGASGDAGRLTGTAITTSRLTLGGAGGEGLHTLTVAEMPAHNHSITDPGHFHIQTSNTIYNTSGPIVSGGAGSPLNTVPGTTTQNAATGISINSNGSGTAHNVVQPTILCNRIMRIV